MVTPLTNDLDDNYDENFLFVEQDFLVNMMANILLDVNTPAPDNNIENTLQQSLNDKNPMKQVITKEEENKLKSVKFRDVLHKDENEMCSITQESFMNDDEIIQLPCSHCFHKDAILNWLTKEKGECPVCRYKFESVELKNEILLNENTEDLQNFSSESTNSLLILPNYLTNEPQVRFGNQAYFDFFTTGPSNNEENL